MSSIAVPRVAALALAGLFIQPVAPPRNAGDSMEQVATLRTARAAHTATTLRSGQVLIVGGMASGGGSLAAVELFDPANNSIADLGSLAERRAGHTATLLGDGRVFVAGGYNGEYLHSVEIFDPTSRRFQRAGSLLEGRSGHTATLLPGGRVLFVGGVGRGWTFLRSAELYDPATGRSEAVGSMQLSRESHTATLLTDGSVLIVGGHTGRRPNMEVHASAEVWTPQARRFEAAGALGTPRHKHDAIRLADGRVLVIAGADRSDRVHYSTTEIYSPRGAAFKPGPSMANRRYKIAGTSVLLPNGDVLVTSGARASEIFDVGSGTFREVAGSLPAAYRFAAAAPVLGGVIVVGGYSDDNQNTGGVWRFRRAHEATHALAQDDTLAVELIAIRDLYSVHRAGRVIALDARFAVPGHAPATLTSISRPVARQHALENALQPGGDSSVKDTLHIRASAPVFQGSVATISVTVSHRGPPGRRRGFYETVAYVVLRRESGAWVINNRTQLGIT